MILREASSLKLLPFFFGEMATPPHPTFNRVTIPLCPPSYDCRKGEIIVEGLRPSGSCFKISAGNVSLGVGASGMFPADSSPPRPALEKRDFFRGWGEEGIIAGYTDAIKTKCRY